MIFLKTFIYYILKTPKLQVKDWSRFFIWFI